ncbi:hypothetical protein B0H10DRAFT_2210142 [Mycena sp. CBHHK59/15]|nr:hypothetical protein B0H10DRAFT_2210142 [Mycena sp. CBHHK59/15]
MNFKWAADGGVMQGPFCSAQGGIKQAGNIATALWSFMIALHLFNLLFLRLKSTRLGFWCTLVGGWGAVIFLIVIGPTVIQTPDKGPYFGISGAWCWITPNYPRERIFLEYFLEYISAGCCIVLYTLVVLRMRGSLTSQDGKWSLRSLPAGESWQLSLRRDIIDSAMLQQKGWFGTQQIVYTMLLLPITIARLTQFAGGDVPFGVTVATDVVFNLTGFANVLLLIATRHLFPDARELPELSTARAKMRKSLFTAGGVTPFTIARSDTAERYSLERSDSLEQHRAARLARGGSARPSLESAEPTCSKACRVGGIGSMAHFTVWSYT